MITVVGDVMLDQAIEVDTNRISPEFPMPVFKFKSSAFDLGGAANVAANIKSLGADVLLIGSVGQRLRQCLLKPPSTHFSKRTRLNDHNIKNALSNEHATL